MEYRSCASLSASRSSEFVITGSNREPLEDLFLDGDNSSKLELNEHVYFLKSCFEGLKRFGLGLDEDVIKPLLG